MHLGAILAPYEDKKMFSPIFSSYFIRTICQVQKSGINFIFTIAVVTNMDMILSNKGITKVLIRML